MFVLKKVQEGDRIKLSKYGIIWIVWHRKNGKNFNSVVQLKAEESGTFRTYNSSNPKWNRQMWYI